MKYLPKYLGLSERPEVKRYCHISYEPSNAFLKEVFNKQKIDDEDRKEYKRNCEELVNAYLDRFYEKKIGISHVKEFAQSCNENLKISVNKCSTLAHSALDKAKNKACSALKKCSSLAHSGLDTLQNKACSAFGVHFLKFQWDGEDTVGNDRNFFKKLSEFIVNSALKIYELGFLSWSEWFVFTTEGQTLINMMIKGKKWERIYGLVIFISMLQTIYITSGYDDAFFKREYFNMLPHLNEVFSDYKDEVVFKAITAGVGSMTANLFLAKVRGLLQATFDVPDEMFKSYVEQDCSSWSFSNKKKSKKSTRKKSKKSIRKTVKQVK